MEFDPEKDYYRTLHIDRHASPAEVKKAFFALAKKYHPDTKKSLHDADVEEVFTEKYREVNEAHQILNDPLLRRDYDRARDLRELGTATPPPRTAPQQPAAEAPLQELPPVIRSDRGAVFVRRGRSQTYLGEDGAPYDVTADGRIRRLADPGLMGSMQRYAVTGTPGEIVVGWIGRILLKLFLGILKVLAAVLVNYPLFLSMTVVHPNAIRRLPQERAYIGFVAYAAFTAMNLLVLLGSILLGVTLNPAFAGVGIALHLVAASLVALDLRAPYLKLLDTAGLASAVSDVAFSRRLRRGIAAGLYLLLIAGTAWAASVLMPPLPVAHPVVPPARMSSIPDPT